jgi:glycosyltransferase involved in cell wall biosynthesis
MTSEVLPATVPSMKIAIIMPAYNAVPFIGDAIASLLRQRADAELDIIVVDDGSTDGTGEVVRQLAATAPEIRLIQQPNSGIARSRNTGLDAVRVEADLVNFLDADDLSPAGRFRRDIAHFRTDPDLDLLYATTRVFRGDRPGQLEPAAQAPSVDVRNIQLADLIMRAPFAGRVGLFDTTFTVSDDVDYLFRALELQPKLQLVDDIGVYYRRHDRNITRDFVAANRDLARALIVAARRRRAGAGVIPKDFFNARPALEALEWW